MLFLLLAERISQLNTDKSSSIHVRMVTSKEFSSWPADLVFWYRCTKLINLFLFCIHNYSFCHYNCLTKSFKLTSNTFAICSSVSKFGWAEFVTHFDTVAWSLPSCSASHLFWMFFSAKMTLIRLRFLLSFSMFDFLKHFKDTIFLWNTCWLLKIINEIRNYILLLNILDVRMDYTSPGISFQSNSKLLCFITVGACY